MTYKVLWLGQFIAPRKYVPGFLELCHTSDTGRSVPSQALFCSYGRSSLVTFADTAHSPQQWYVLALPSNQSSKRSTLRQPLRRLISGSAAVPVIALISISSKSFSTPAPFNCFPIFLIGTSVFVFISEMTGCGYSRCNLYPSRLVHTSWHLLPAIVRSSSCLLSFFLESSYYFHGVIFVDL